MKFSGKVGFWLGTEETSPGINDPIIKELPYTGDVGWANRHFQSTENQNEDVKLNNQISIIADLYMQEHFSSIRYVVWNNIPWSVTNVEIGFPRVTLTIGGVWNGFRE